MPVPSWYQLKPSSGDLYRNEDKSNKPSKNEDANVVTDTCYTPASLSSSSSSFSTSNLTLASSTSCRASLAPPRTTTATSTVTQQAGIFSFSSASFQDSSLPQLFFSQVTKITNKLANAGISVDVNTIQRVLRGRYANGDPEKAFDLLTMIEDSNDGIVTRVRGDVKMLGAENNGGVTCYLDTLLFAMFARLDAFEAILYNVFDEEDERRKKLAALIRLFVNLLRSGKLITTDIIFQMQQSLAECGWEGATSKDQQDTSELFAFLTDTLQLPLLTVKVDIAHGGKEMVDDDHKFISERLLNIPLPKEVPGEAPGSNVPLRLEDCLDEYFGSRVEIRRKLERRKTGDSIQSVTPDSVHYCDSLKGESLHIETQDLGSNPTSPAATPISPSSSSTLTRSKLPIFRTIRDKSEVDGVDRKANHSGPVRPDVLVPAWCFFSILPFYTASSSTVPSTYAEHFSAKRPVLGMCLKRYHWTPNGAIRDSRPVDIPLEIALPKFVTDDEMRDDDGLVYGNFRLVLQSAVCHRGETINSGHYIALVRGDEGKWFLFDDLDINERVSVVDPKMIFEKESPYLLFYQVRPIDEGEPPTPTSSFNSADGKSGKRLSLVSKSSNLSHTDPVIQEPPKYQKHEPGVESSSPPPPYRHHNPLEPTLLHEPNRDTESLRPSSRSMKRHRSKDGSKDGLKSRSGSDGSQKRSSWAPSLRRSRRKSQEKERRSGECGRYLDPESRDKQRKDSGDEAFEDTGATTDNEQPENTDIQPKEQDKKKGKRRSRDKGKGKEWSDSSGKKEKEYSQCTIQ